MLTVLAVTIPFDLDLDEILAAPEPWDALARQRERGPIAKSRYGLHIMDFAAAQELLRDRRFETNALPLLDGAGLADATVRSLWSSALLGSAPLDHDRIRRLVAPYFTRRVVDTLREYVVDLIGRLAADADTDADTEPIIDVVGDIFLKVPPLVFTQMIGAPEEDAEQIGHWSAEILQIFARDPKLAPRIETAQLALLDYVDEFIEARRRTPGGGDMISALLEAEEDGERLSNLELRAVIGEALEASTDNTTTALAALLYAGALHPDSWQQIRQDPALIPSYVEEVGRMLPRIVHTYRTALEDVHWRGLDITAGTELFVAVPATLRDPEVFDEPDRFDAAREVPATYNLNYGSGVHLCIGAALARMEMQGALEVLTKLWQRVELAGPPRISVNLGVVTIESLPLRAIRATAATNR